MRSHGCKAEHRLPNPSMKTQLPPLKIGTPCPKRWEEMSGNGMRRFCEHCELHVHNLSAMPNGERERFVEESQGRACIAYELRKDGTMVTPTLWQRTRWIGVTLLATLFPFVFTACASRKAMLGKPSIWQDANCKSQSGPDTYINAI